LIYNSMNLFIEQKKARVNKDREAMGMMEYVGV
jgi:hypothetical protein